MREHSPEGRFDLVVHQLELLRELNDVKRLYDFNFGCNSFTSKIFHGATKALSTNNSLKEGVWTALVVCAARLGAITPSVLLDVGINRDSMVEIFKNSIRLHRSLPSPLLNSLLDACTNVERTFIKSNEPILEWVERLTHTPRAGATCPGKPRIVLEPPEMHSDHCVMVATYGYILADAFGANRQDVWLIGLCHHLHNAFLPDAGFTGEKLLGDHLANIIDQQRVRVLNTFSPFYKEKVLYLFDEVNNIESALFKAFTAADTIDRIIQMEYYERSARFKTIDALSDFNLVHEGAAQDFQHVLLDSIGIQYRKSA